MNSDGETCIAFARLAKRSISLALHYRVRMVLLSEIQKTWIERVKKRTGCRCYDDESLSIALKKSKRMCRKALH